MILLILLLTVNLLISLGFSTLYLLSCDCTEDKRS
jgi:hypothetical protein